MKRKATEGMPWGGPRVPGKAMTGTPLTWLKLKEVAQGQESKDQPIPEPKDWGTAQPCHLREMLGRQQRPGLLQVLRFCLRVKARRQRPERYLPKRTDYYLSWKWQQKVARGTSTQHSTCLWWLFGLGLEEGSPRDLTGLCGHIQPIAGTSHAPHAHLAGKNHGRVLLPSLFPTLSLKSFMH